MIKKKYYFWDTNQNMITEWPKDQTCFNTKVVGETFEAAHCLYAGRMDMISRDIWMSEPPYRKNNPELFLELAQDENVELRNFGIKAVEAGLLVLTPDQREFKWKGNKRRVMTVPFDEHPYSALAAFFKTDEGVEIYKNIEKRLK